MTKRITTSRRQGREERGGGGKDVVHRQDYIYKYYYIIEILILYYTNIIETNYSCLFPFTLKNKSRNTNLKLTLKSTILDPLKKCVFGFLHVLLVSFFENAQKKLLTAKNAILAILGS